MRKFIFISLLVGLLSPSLVLAEGSSFYNNHRTAMVNRKWSLQPIGWNAGIDGHIKVVENENPATGQKIDLKKDTKNVEKEKALGINFAYEATKRISVEFNMINVKHEGNLGVARRFKGKNYNADTKYKIKDNIFDLLMGYRLWHSMCQDGREKRHISWLTGVKASVMDFGMSGQVGAITENTNYKKTLPIPYVGLEFGTFIGKMLYFKASVRAMGLDISDYKANHIDYNLSLSYRLSGDDSLHDILMDVGYRSVAYDLDGKGNDIELEYSGPYIGFDMLF